MPKKINSFRIENAARALFESEFDQYIDLILGEKEDLTVHRIVRNRQDSTFELGSTVRANLTEKI